MRIAGSIRAMTTRQAGGDRRLASLVACLLLAACGSSTGTGQPPVTTTGPGESPSANAAGTPTPSATASAALSTGPSTFDPAGVSLDIRVVVDSLTNPVDVASAHDGTGRLFVVEQPGRIRLVEDGRLVTRPFLDITSEIASGGERGLLGLAFHPDFPADPRLFVDYTDRDGDTVVSEFTVDPADGDVAEPGSERILLQIDQPFPNHNGGAVAFGPDGMLYVAMGDGGSGGDPQGNGQRLDTLLAKILRIDVDGRPEGGAAYRIPDDNPFLGKPGAMPEIWLTGLRNPWRIRFDTETGDLWIGDVGQGAWEEIDVAPVGTGGLNFGWNVMEGFHCYQPDTGCDQAGLTLPIAEYGHGLGCAVIGGVVVRDADQGRLNGGYLFADECSGNIWLLDPSDTTTRQEPVLAIDTGRSISAISLDEDGTVLATDLGTGQLLAVTARGP
jgi:glucose/arabinose dehydrogenase